MKEVWRDIPGFEGYQVSDQGRVRSRRKPGPNAGELSDEWHLMSPFTDQQGYLGLHLAGPEKPVRVKVHRLVLEAFVGPCPPGEECCHNKGDPADNHLENLRWDTRSSNVKDAYKHGRLPCGAKHRQSKLTSDDVRKIRSLYASGNVTYQELADRFGITPSTIGSVIEGKTWNHVDGALSDTDLKSLHSRILNDRRPRGAKNGASKLTPDDVREIRNLYASGNVTYQELADRFGMHRCTIGSIIRRELWKHIE